MVTQTLVFQIEFCGKCPVLRLAAKRWHKIARVNKSRLTARAELWKRCATEIESFRARQITRAVLIELLSAVRAQSVHSYNSVNQRLNVPDEISPRKLGFSRTDRKFDLKQLLI